jgi:hypothetical protein
MLEIIKTGFPLTETLILPWEAPLETLVRTGNPEIESNYSKLSVFEGRYYSVPLEFYTMRWNRLDASMIPELSILQITGCRVIDNYDNNPAKPFNGPAEILQAEKIKQKEEDKLKLLEGKILYDSELSYEHRNQNIEQVISRIETIIGPAEKVDESYEDRGVVYSYITLRWLVKLNSGKTLKVWRWELWGAV